MGAGSEHGAAPAACFCFAVVSAGAPSGSSQPRLLARHPPAPDAEGDSLPPQLPTCCLPAGDAGVPRARGAAARYPVVLTTGAGARVYAACVAYRERDGSARCACLLSRRPQLGALAGLLDAVVAAGEGARTEEARVRQTVRAAARLIDGCGAGAAAGGRAGGARLLAVGRRVVACPPAGAEAFALGGTIQDGGSQEGDGGHAPPPLECLMGLSGACVERAWVACLLERRVLLRSRQLAALAPAAEALCSLLAPLRWQHVYIPALPLSLEDALDAPTPFLMGLVGIEGADGPLPGGVDGVVEVDLDASEVTADLDEDLPSLPASTRLRLRREMGDALAAARAGRPGAELLVRRAFANAMHSLLPQPNGKRAPAAKAARKENDKEGTEAFLSQLYDTQAYMAFEAEREAETAGADADRGGAGAGERPEGECGALGGGHATEYFTPPADGAAPSLPPAGLQLADAPPADEAFAGAAIPALAATLGRAASESDGVVAAAVVAEGRPVTLDSPSFLDAVAALRAAVSTAAVSAQWVELWHLLCCARLLRRRRKEYFGVASALQSLAGGHWNTNATLSCVLKAAPTSGRVPQAALTAATILADLGWHVDDTWDALCSSLAGLGTIGAAGRLSVRAAMQHAHELRRDTADALADGESDPSDIRRADGGTGNVEAYTQAADRARALLESELFTEAAPGLRSVARVHTGRVVAVAVLDAGRGIVASIGEDKRLAVTSVAGSEESAVGSADVAGSTAMSVGAGGAVFVGAAMSGRVACALRSGGLLIADAAGGRIGECWHAVVPARGGGATGSPSARSPGDGATCGAVVESFAGGSPLLALGTQSGGVCVWDARCPPDQLAGFFRCGGGHQGGKAAHAFAPVSAVALGSPLATPGAASAGGGLTLAAGTAAGALHAWDMRSAEALLSVPPAGARRRVTSLRLAPAANSLVAGCADWTVRVHKLSGESIGAVATLVGHSGAVTSVAAQAGGDNLHVLAGDAAGCVRLWAVGSSANSGEEADSTATLVRSHDGDVHTCLTACGKLALAAGRDGRLHAWGLSAGEGKAPLRPVPRRGTMAPSAALCAAGGGRSLAVGGVSGCVSVWTPA